VAFPPQQNAVPSAARAQVWSKPALTCGRVTGIDTSASALPETLPAVAVIVAVPLATAVTVPVPVTEATAVLEDAQMKVASTTTVPSEDLAVAVN
jgi:hypothetical protein